MQVFLKLANLALLVAFPLSWFAPILRTALTGWFGLDDVSVISGIQALWGEDARLALLVTFFAIFAPMLKTIGLSLIHFDLMRREVLPVLNILGKLAMADIFLIALYIVVIKGVGVGTVETAWGLWFFTGCVLASIVIGHLTGRRGDGSGKQGCA